MSKYVGGAIVVFDLRLRRVKWQQHLDLSTDSTDYRAYIYSAPVLADLDRDGKLEIVVGTSAVRLPRLCCSFGKIHLRGCMERCSERWLYTWLVMMPPHMFPRSSEADTKLNVNNHANIMHDGGTSKRDLVCN